MAAVMLVTAASASAAPPFILITAPTDGSYHRTNVPPLGVTDDGSSVTLDCRFDAQAWVDCATELSILTGQTLGEGAHSFSVRGENAGNEVTTVSVSFTIDRTVPTVAIADFGSPTSVSSPSFAFSASDAFPGSSDCRIFLFGGSEPAFAPCTSATTFSSPPLTDGNWVMQVRHTDLAGNAGFDSVSFVVDTVNPTLTIRSPQPNQVLQTSIPELDLSFADPDPGTGVATAQCAFDSDALALCGDDAFSNRRLTDGQHTLHVRVTDGAGNVAEQIVPFSVDTSLGPPEATSLTLKRLSKRVKRGKLRLRVRLTATLAKGVDPVAACGGKARIKVTGKLRKKRARSFTKRVALKRSGSTCVATTTFALPRAYKRGFIKGVAVVQGNGSLAAGTARARL